MGDDKDARVPGNDIPAQSIAKETGITEDQARELIHLIGTDRNSLLREAQQLLRNPSAVRTTPTRSSSVESLRSSS